MTGTHHIVATIYTNSYGGHSIWQGTYEAEIKNGLYTISLGSGKYPFPDITTMDRPLWLGISIDSSEEMVPLTQLAAVPYALNVPDGSITSAKLSPDVALGLGHGNNPTIQSTGSWNLGGNSITPPGDTLGTTNSQNWSLIANKIRTFRFQVNTVVDSPWNDIIGGYSGNTITDGTYGGSNVIAGGGFNVDYNSANEIHKSDIAAIGGGAHNKIGDTTETTAHRSQTIAGGSKNKAKEDYATVGGGHCNEAQAQFSGVFSGNWNMVADSSSGWGLSSVIGGGDTNMVESQDAAILGGRGNMLDHNSNTSFIDGGVDNMIMAVSSAISGGQNNTITGTLSAIPGGSNLKLADHSFGFNGGSSLVDLSSQSNIAAFNNVNLFIGNTDNTARQLQLFSPSSSGSMGGAFTAFKAQAQEGGVSFIYTLPDSIAEMGSILFSKVNHTGITTPLSSTLSWLRAGSNGQILTIRSGIPTWDTSSGGGGHYKWYEESTATPIVSPSATGVGAVSHGENVSAQANHSAIGGGTLNIIDTGAIFSNIAGGDTNTIQINASHSGIGSGRDNLIDTGSAYSMIAGGLRDTIQTHLYLVNDSHSESGVDTICLLYTSPSPRD